MTSYVNSVQQFTVSISAAAATGTATIPSVSTTNSVVEYNGFTSADTGNNFALFFAGVAQTSGTQITATRGVTASSQALVVYGTLTDYTASAVNSVQHGTTSLTSGTSATTTITSVTTANSVLFWGGQTNGSADNFIGREAVGATLTNATTVTLNKGINPGTNGTGYWTIANFNSAVVQSIQQFAISVSNALTSATQAITAVNTSNALVIWGGFTVGGTNIANGMDWLYRAALTSTILVTLTRGGTASTDTRVIYLTVWELPSGILNSAVQRGTVTLTSQTSNTATISSVNTSFAFVNWCGFSMAVAAVPAGTSYSSLNLSAPTAVQGKMNTANATANISSFEVAEFPATVAPVDVWPSHLPYTNKIYVDDAPVQQKNLFSASYSPQQLQLTTEWFALRHVNYDDAPSQQQKGLFSPAFSLQQPALPPKTVEWILRRNAVYADDVTPQQKNLFHPDISAQQLQRTVEWLARSKAIAVDDIAAQSSRAAWNPAFTSAVITPAGIEWLKRQNAGQPDEAARSASASWNASYSPQQLQRTIEWLPRTRIAQEEAATASNKAAWGIALSPPPSLPKTIEWLQRAKPPQDEAGQIINRTAWGVGLSPKIPAGIEWLKAGSTRQPDESAIINSVRWLAATSVKVASGIEWLTIARRTVALEIPTSNRTSWLMFPNATQPYLPAPPFRTLDPLPVTRTLSASAGGRIFTPTDNRIL